MSPGAARGAVSVVRREAARALRCLSVPEPDWEGATGHALRAGLATLMLLLLCREGARGHGRRRGGSR